MSLSEVQYTQNKDISEHDCLIIINLQSIQNYEVEYKFSKSSSNKIIFWIPRCGFQLRITSKYICPEQKCEKTCKSEDVNKYVDREQSLFFLQGLRLLKGRLKFFSTFCIYLCNQEAITRRGQFSCSRVTAFSLTSLFLERSLRELRISFMSHKPVIETKTARNGIFDLLMTVDFLCRSLYLQYNALMNGTELSFSR